MLGLYSDEERAMFSPLEDSHRRQQAENILQWEHLSAQYNAIGHHGREMIRGMSLSGALARFHKEGRSEDFINGYLEGLKARG